MRSSNLSISLGRYNRDWWQHVGETLSGLGNSLIRRVNTKAGEVVQFLVEKGAPKGEREREREGERERKQEKAKGRERKRKIEREERYRATRYSMSLHGEQEDHCRIADRPATECAIFITRALVIASAIRGRARKSRPVQPAGENAYAFGDRAHHRGHKFQSRRYDRTESSAETRTGRGCRLDSLE